MSGLIRSELIIFLVMAVCGITAGLIGGLFKSYITARGLRKFGSIVMQLIMYAIVGVMISEFFYFCDNGKITATGIGSFLMGLWLWKKFFCDILTLTEADNDKEKGRSKNI